MKVMTEETKAKIKATKEDVKIHHITEKYRVVGRKDEFTIEEKKKNKTTGEEIWEPMGHHIKLGSSISSISRHVVRDSMDDLLYVSGQLDRIEEVCNRIDNK